MKLFIIMSIVAIILIIVYLLLVTQQNKVCKNDKTKLKNDYCDDDCTKLKNAYCDDDCKTLRTEDMCKSDCTKLKTAYCNPDCTKLKTAYESCQKSCLSSDNSCKLPLTNEKSNCSFEFDINKTLRQFEFFKDGKLYWKIPFWKISNSLTPNDLVMQNDGNLVLYDSTDSTSKKVVWASNSKQQTPNPPYQLTLNDDGTLVIYDKDGNSIWPTWSDPNITNPC
jgi:hypothetical protein